jgi:hypothetical protein
MIQRGNKRRRRAGRGERRLSLAVLGLLVVIALAIGVASGRYDAARYAAPVPGAASHAPSDDRTPGPSPDHVLARLVPGDYEPIGRLERFDAQTLYEKINGKNDLYLTAGFVELGCRRFAQAGTGRAFEAFVYRMKDADAAFAVYSNQRRPDAEASPVAARAYRTVNALFFTSGVTYVELVSADFEGGTLADLEAFGETLDRDLAPAGAEASDGPPFPRQGLVSDSLSLKADSVFGFARLDRIYTASYRADGVELTAFLSLRQSSEEAAELAAAYRAFLLANGGRALETQCAIPGAWVIEILDSYEAVFAAGGWFGGVHMADDQAHALQLLSRLFDAVDGGAP